MNMNESTAMYMERLGDWKGNVDYIIIIFSQKQNKQ